MPKYKLILLFLLLTVVSPLKITGQDFPEILEKYRNALISLTVEIQNVENGQIEKGNGTGFLISSNGFILTANHVVKIDDKKVIRSIKGRVGDLYSEPEFDLEIVENIEKYDIVLLRFKSDNSTPYTAVPLGNSRDVKLGQKLFAIGFSAPFDLNYHLSEGLYNGRQGTLWMTDTPSNKGESGSPVFSALTGRVVAIKNSAAIGGQGTNFLTPLYLAGDVVRVHTGLEMVDPKPTILGFIVTFETGSNPKDSALKVGTSIEKDGQKIGEILGLGDDEQWGEGHTVSTQIPLSNPLPIDQCSNLRIVVDKTHRFQWDVRFRVEAKISDGRTIPVLSTTKTYRLGNKNDNTPAIERLNCLQ